MITPPVDVFETEVMLPVVEGEGGFGAGTTCDGG